MLYPYRPSAVKNRQRFNFGVVYPRVYAEAQGGTDTWTMQTECLVLGNEATQCVVRVRFLRMVARSVGKLLEPSSERSALTKANIERVERLEVNGKIYQAWQEAVEEVIEVAEFNLSALDCPVHAMAIPAICSTGKRSNSGCKRPDCGNSSTRQSKYHRERSNSPPHGFSKVSSNLRRASRT